MTLLRQHKWAEAEATAKQALAIRNRLHSAQDGSAVDLDTLALVRLQWREYQTAIALKQMAIRKCRESSIPEKWSLISHLHTLAVIRWNAGQASASIAAFEEALCALEASSFSSLLEKSNLLSDYASVLRKTGQRRKARMMDRQAKATRAVITAANPTGRYVVNLQALLPRP